MKVYSANSSSAKYVSHGIGLKTDKADVAGLDLKVLAGSGIVDLNLEAVKHQEVLIVPFIVRDQNIVVGVSHHRIAEALV